MVTDNQIAAARERSVLDLAIELGAPEALRRAPERGVPCPGCGGTDRFSVNPVKNVFLCRYSSTGGDAITLMQHVHGLSFADAVEALVGGAAMPERPARRQPVADGSDYFREQARRRAYSLWHTAQPAGALVRAYLARRGIPLPDWRLTAIRERDRLDYWHTVAGENRIIHSGPAILAAITDDAGRFIGLHRTWVDVDRPNGKATIPDPDGDGTLDAKKVMGSQRGGRIVLRGGLVPGDHAGDGLAAGEGIETVLSWDALRGGGFDLWSAVNLDNLAGKAREQVPHPSAVKCDALGRRRRKKVPGPVPDLADDRCLSIPAGHWRRLVLIGDGDSDRFTTEAAMLRALARHRDAASDASIDWAPRGADFNDILRGRAA